MSKIRKISISVAFLLCLVMAFSVTAMAIGRIEGEDFSLTVKFQKADYQMEGVPVKLYKVGELDEGGNATVATEFAGIDLFDKDDLIANAKSKIAQDEMIVPLKTQNTDADFKAEFEDLDKGVYLVIIDPYTDADGMHRYSIQAAVVSVPSQDAVNDVWDNDVEVQLKGEDIENLKTEYTVVINWENEKNEDDRPESITVNINDGAGEEYPVEVKADDGWIGSFKGSKGISWYVNPETIKNYKVSVSQEDDIISITYTHEGSTVEIIIDGPDEEEEIPNTGLLWWPVAVLAVAGLLFVTYGVLRKKSKQE